MPRSSQVSAQRPVVAVGLVGRDPAERDAGRDRAVDHQLQQLRLGPERRLLRDSRGGQPLLVPGPGAGQVKLPVDQRPALRARIGEEHPELAVRDLPGRARVLPLHPGRPAAALLEPGVVPDQDAVRAAERGGDVTAQVITDSILVPAGRREQPLHPVRACLPGVLGQ